MKMNANVTMNVTMNDNDMPVMNVSVQDYSFEADTEEVTSWITAAANVVGADAVKDIAKLIASTFIESKKLDIESKKLDIERLDKELQIKELERKEVTGNTSFDDKMVKRTEIRRPIK